MVKGMYDEDGNPLPELDPTSNAYQLVALLHHCRKYGFRIGPTVQVGDVIVQVQDLEQRLAKEPSLPRDKGPWAAAGHDEDEFGGPAE